MIGTASAELWDAWSSPDVPLCSLVAQLLSFKQEFLKLYDWSKESIVNHTGCLTPCMYTEYSLATTPIYYEDGYFKIQIALTSFEVIDRTKEIIYPMEYFVS